MIKIMIDSAADIGRDEAVEKGIIMLPMILPPFVGALGIQQLLGYYGVVNTILAECLGVGRISLRH